MDAAQEIKSRLDIADLIGEYLPLKMAGSGAFKAVCPFHQEKTPSFYVSRARQSWHCFGCDQGGDHFTFLEKMEGMEFREVLELLAQKTGVVLPAFDKEKVGARQRIHEVNELAMRFFQTTLNTAPKADVARQYLIKRGVDDLTADLFHLGYAPGEWSALTDALLKKGVTADELLQAGLVAKREQGSGVYDRFRDRLMFPIADVHGKIVGFTGRILTEDKKEAKYVNTPETAVYKKSAVLYGLDKAKGEIRQQDVAIIVEGNMDVIGSHQFGVANVVAASGTALTGEQLALLKRFTTNLAIAFDQDAAGAAATLRGLDLARAQDFSIKIITLPPEAGKDPDEAVRKNPQLWKDAIKQAVSIMEWVYRQAFKGRHAEQPEEKKMIARDILIEIKRIADPVERDHWLRRLAQDLGVGEEALREVMTRTPVTKSAISSSRVAPSAPPHAPHDPGIELERRVFSLLLVHQDVWRAADDLNIIADDFLDATVAGLYGQLKLMYAHGEQVAASAPRHAGTVHPPTTLTPDEMRFFNASALQAEQEFQGQPLEAVKRELKTGLDQLRAWRKARERKKIEQEMRAAERLGDQSRIAELLRQFESLM